MRWTCIVLLVVVALLVADCDAGRRRRRRRRRRGRWFNRVWKGIKKVYKRFKTFVQEHPYVVKAVLTGRDVHTLDANKDGTIDKSEAEKFTNHALAARDLLSLADEDGDSVVSLEEFERSVRDLILMDEDDLDQQLENVEDI